MRKNTKILALGAATLTLAMGGWFSYQEYFTKGLDSLPEKVCDESVPRETVIRILPESRSAEEGSDTSGSGNGFMYSCHIYGDGDSILSGEVKIQNSSVKGWEDYYQSYGGKSGAAAEKVSFNGMHALARSNFASIYVPCVPSTTKPGTTSGNYALVSEVRVIGESRTAGTALHQALTDFAYGITQHAHRAGNCGSDITFPTQPPRFEEDQTGR
ncbi:hypothetical protein OG802_26210 [Streptomyces sp. NBC_00704]|uniref:hypothetical protein n=1 Tax=Streptomyces sp. NBC_00704 TaxID=2975809 RepID=UPI002E32F79C|nr:hypothetical protein [Streptomyces sp. NBC_00704]